MGEQLEFRLLGSIEVVRNGESRAVGGPRQRVLLGLLLVDAGRPVSADRLIDELWEGNPPAGARASLRSYVSRLRAAIDDSTVVSAVSGGYRLEVEQENVDAQRFERLAREGEEALARRRPGDAAERLRQALALWHGPPFGGLIDTGTLAVEAERLEQLRLRIIENRIEADLALGGGGTLVDEIEVILRDHPYRERLWGQLMLALYRSGRQAEALAAYRKARTLLLDALGIEPGEELRQLEQAILRQDVPAVTGQERRRTLPAPLTTFVGRETELSDVARLLSGNRLVTLTGVGGVGKTRLGLELAWRSKDAFADGVVFCDLAVLSDAALVAPEVASALGIREQAEPSTEAALDAQVGDSDLLVVLDNCEHLLEACAEIAHTLLSAGPAVRILSTSARPLGLDGEVDYPVPPLRLFEEDPGPEELRSSEAVQLFLARAREARPSLDDSASLSSIAEICADLDGHPLAIELAAARAKSLSVDEIAARLTDRFRFLVSWRRLTAARHSTLREAMDWSFELLSDAERDLLCSLSVFAGGFTLVAVARVCVEGDEDLALELVGRLVDASLVVTEDEGRDMRYRLLETVRQYAAARLAEAAAADRAQRRHAEWCTAVAEEAEQEVTGPAQAQWFTLLETEADNMRAALAFLRESGDLELWLRLTISLSRFWYVRGHLGEARLWLERALSEAPDADASLRRRGLTAGAAVTLLQGDYMASAAFAEQALAVARESGDDLYVANGLSNLGAIVLAGGDADRAAVLLDEAVALAREVGDARITALAINNRGDVALTTGDYEQAEPLFEESLALLRSRGDTANVARSLFNLGAVALQLGRLDDAAARFRESLTLAEEAGDREDLAWCLEGVAALAGARGRSEQAGVLLGAAGALLAAMGAAFKPFERQLHEATELRVRTACGDDAVAALAERGSSMTMAEALVHALAEVDLA